MRFTPTCILAATAILLSACTPQPWTPAAPVSAFSDFASLTVEQSACLFQCPTFEARIFADGRVEHGGPSFAHLDNAATGHATPEQLIQLAQAVRALGFEQMRDHYTTEADGCEDSITDQSTLTFTLTRNAHSSKQVEVYTGCWGAHIPSDRINALVKAIDRVSGTGALLAQQAPMQPDF